MRNREAGQALVVAALTLTVLLGAAGLAIDMGYLRYQKRRMQTAADSAAIAGASQLTANWSQSAKDDAQLNGFQDGTAGVVVTPTANVACPDGSTACVQVVVSQPQQLFFMKIINGITQPTISAQATAEMVPGKGAMYALSTDSDAMQLGLLGETFVFANGESIIDNGTLTLQSGNPSHTIKAQSVGAGTFSQSGQFPNMVPVSTGIQMSPDPLSYIAPPNDPGTCNGSGPTVYNVGQVVPPGPYPCGLSLNGGNATTPIQLQGGYQIGGSGLSIGNSAYVTGTATLYVSGANAAVNINNGASGPSSFGATIQLQAPNDASGGGIPGVLVFQDRGDAQPASITLAGFLAGYPTSTDSYMWGALYFPDATLSLDGIGYDDLGYPLDGCSPVPRVTQVIANKLSLNGNINLGTDDCSQPAQQVTTTVSSPIKNAVLVK